MPIRMVDDPSGPSNDKNYRRSSNTGGGGNLINFLPLLLGLFRSKFGWVLILIIVGGYFFLNRSGSSLGDSLSQLATGGFLDPKEFDKASIYESLAEDDTKNPLPGAANLYKFAPPVGNQGSQGSCVGWSSAYAARTILEAARSGARPSEIAYSPAFLYNQIGLQGCQGTYIVRAMEYMTQKGSLRYSEFPYDENNCSRQPDQSLLTEAREHRMQGFNRLTKGNTTDEIDLRAIKENLSQGAPVVIGMMVGNSFMQGMMGQDVWEPASGDERMVGFGGHAMCVVGYDDRQYGGAFLIMNSWGSEWGRNGFAWVRYPEFQYFVREAYGLEPMRVTGAQSQKTLTGEMGLVAVDFNNNELVNKGYIALQKTGSYLFNTSVPITMGTRFKMEIKNDIPCYIYVFGKEEDGTSYTLFPYPETNDPSKTKYSAFCGITGYRLFPKDKSMTPDKIGNKDYIAVVVSDRELNWVELNKKLSQNPQSDFQTRCEQVFQPTGNVQLASSSKGTIQFKATSATGLALGVIAIDKTN
ncbi:C1 family peptidase [Gynurincola endophyticus]|uniref:C1 family peptidase n=1 Tax=Gynurincola endophyticus TaxID=2479004 RepID=UPI000F8D58B1|nr:C1 family peptidase [Gynurincola endophyticus]